MGIPGYPCLIITIKPLINNPYLVLQTNLNIQQSIAFPKQIPGDELASYPFLACGRVTQPET